MTYGLGMAELVHGDVKRSNSPAPPISPPYANHPDRTTARSDTPSSCNPFATNVKSFGSHLETYCHARKSQGGSPGELGRFLFLLNPRPVRCCLSRSATPARTRPRRLLQRRRSLPCSCSDPLVHAVARSQSRRTSPAP